MGVKDRKLGRKAFLYIPVTTNKIVNDIKRIFIE